MIITIIIKRYLYYVYIWNIFQYYTFIMIMFYIWNNIFFILKKNMMCQDFNGRFNYRVKFIFNQKIYIKIMRCKIVRFQKLMWCNIIRSTKSKKSFDFILLYRQIITSQPMPCTGWSRQCNNNINVTSRIQNISSTRDSRRTPVRHALPVCQAFTNRFSK